MEKNKLILSFIKRSIEGESGTLSIKGGGLYSNNILMAIRTHRTCENHFIFLVQSINYTGELKEDRQLIIKLLSSMGLFLIEVELTNDMIRPPDDNPAFRSPRNEHVWVKFERDVGRSIDEIFNKYLSGRSESQKNKYMKVIENKQKQLEVLQSTIWTS